MKMLSEIGAFILLFLFFSLSGCKEDEAPPFPDFPEPDTEDTTFYKGMDLSYQPFLQPYQVEYKDPSGKTVDDLLKFLQDNGVNLIRVRLFHSPDPTDAVLNASNLEKVVLYCNQIALSGNNILLDIHYSDTWADPGHQSIPTAWNNLSVNLMNDSIYRYTKFVLNKLKTANALPKIVQIGNETNSGFLWNTGKVWNEFENNWPNYVLFINSANKAIQEVADESGKKIKSMVHIAEVTGAVNFFSKLKEHGAQYDMIGLSYYPYYHSKDLAAIQSGLNQLANSFSKPIIIVETSYPFTLGWNDWTHNMVGLEDQLIQGYPATPEGQKAYFEKLIQIMHDVPNNFGRGFVWWAPDMVAFNGLESAEGSSFENLAAFDFDNISLPVLEAFNKK
jgi:arabinogalactan endo-1,4-beta-galactosidase